MRFSHALELGEELATFIGTRLAAHGARRRPVVLALASDLVKSGVVEIPAVTQRETEAVVGRRCAALIGTDINDVLFSGLCLDGEDVPERRWLIHACPRTALTDFQSELRSIGYPVRVAVPARTAPFLSSRCVDAAEASRTEAAEKSGPDGLERSQGADSAGATLVALFEPDACAIGLVSEGRLVQLTELPGGAHSHLTEEHTARAFVQELRGIDAFWRRTSRGDRVTSVVVAGVESLVVDRMRSAIHGALGDVVVHALERESLPESAVGGVLSVGGLDALDGPDDVAPLDDAAEEARIALLASFHSPRVAALDLAAPLRPRARTVLGIGGASLIACSTMALAMRADFEGRAMSISTEARVVAAASRDLDTLRGLESSARHAEAELSRVLAEMREISGTGVDTRTLLSGVLSAFDDSAVFLSASAVGGAPGQAGGGALRLRGAVEDRPGQTSATLGRLEARLRQVDGVADVAIEMPNLGDRAADMLGGGRGSLRFSGTLELIDRRPSSYAPKAADTQFVGPEGTQ